ncbi:MAG TPA: hypothetical protein VNE39_23055 [Planctomycetota bacterium]|nr:hypothetical protein [Planctomycetota bacterium]
MEEVKELPLDVICQRAEREAARLAGEFARAASEDRGAILDALEFEKWFAESCRFCQNGRRLSSGTDS